MLFRTPSSASFTDISLTTVQAGSEVDLKRKVDEALAALALAAPTGHVLGYSVDGTGDGTQWQATIVTGTLGNLFGQTLAAGVTTGLDAFLLLSEFGAAASPRSQIVFAQAGTAAEATSQLRTVMANVDPIGNTLTPWDLGVVGSANAGQWLAYAFLADAP